jgi:hypothetical protein
MSGGIAYFWKSYTSTVSGSTTRRVTCVGCSRVYEYPVSRTAAGGGHSPLFLTNAGAAEKARQRARANLDRALMEAIEPVHCPTCGIYQPDMVPLLRKHLGKNYEPNYYAKLRTGLSPEETWRAACKGNTIKSYTNFMQIWPTYSSFAKAKISELKYPPHFRKWVSRLAWVGWVGLFFILFYIISAER